MKKISKADLERQSAKIIGIQLIQTTAADAPKGIGMEFVPIVRLENGIMAVLGSHSTSTTQN